MRGKTFSRKRFSPHPFQKALYDIGGKYVICFAVSFCDLRFSFALGRSWLCSGEEGRESEETEDLRYPCCCQHCSGRSDRCFGFWFESIGINRTEESPVSAAEVSAFGTGGCFYLDFFSFLPRSRSFWKASFSAYSGFSANSSSQLDRFSNVLAFG